MPRYSKHGKIQTPLTDKEFIEGMKHGHFVAKNHRGFCVLLYYSAVRKMEALRVKREQFILGEDVILFDVLKRLKHGKLTQALHLPLKAQYMKELYEAIESTSKGRKVFRFCPKTAYNVVARVWKYPHLFRLSRITQFFLDGWTIPQVKSWTGLTLRALDYYVGIVDTIKMGESLAKHRSKTDR